MFKHTIFYSPRSTPSALILNRPVGIVSDRAKILFWVPKNAPSLSWFALYLCDFSYRAYLRTNRMHSEKAKWKSSFQEYSTKKSQCLQ